MFRSIRWRLVASYTLMTVLSVTLVGVLALFLIERYLLRQERDYLTMNATAVAQQLEPLLSAPIPQPALEELARTTAFVSDVHVRILDAKEELLADSGVPSQLDGVTWLMPEAQHVAGEVFTAPMEPGFFVQVLPDQAHNPSPMGWRKQITPGMEAGRPVAPPILLFRRANGFWAGPGELTSSPTDQMITPAQPSSVMKPYSPYEKAPPSWSSISAFWQPAPTAPQRVMQAVGNGGNVVGYVELSSGPDFGAAALALIQRAFLLAGVGVSLIAVFVALWMSRSLTAPLHDLIDVTDQMRTGALSARAVIRTRDEIGLLATQFNTMATQLERSFAELAAERDALRRFVADASHELRTPITALKTFGELLLGPAGAAAATRTEFLQESQKQVQRLEWITSALLKLSRLDAGLTELNPETIDLRDLVAATVKPFMLRTQEKLITLTYAAAPLPILVLCDPAYLEMALANLLDNALKFTSAGGAVQIGATVAGERVELWVQDNGPGIAPEDRPYIFDRFYRGLHPTAAQAEAGSGLGLAIVQSIVKAHRGQVAVQSEVGIGSRFIVKLPLAGMGQP